MNEYITVAHGLLFILSNFIAIPARVLVDEGHDFAVLFETTMSCEESDGDAQLSTVHGLELCCSFIWMPMYSGTYARVTLFFLLGFSSA